MWILYAVGSAVFAGLTAIPAKLGIRNLESNLATALRTIVVLLFAWLMVFIGGSQSGLAEIGNDTLVFLILSGLATGASWLCYFKALQLGDVNKVTPIDKSSTVLTMILAFIFLGEPVGILQILCMVLISAGTYLMIAKKCVPNGENKQKASNAWFVFACLSALFASLTAILGKIGISGVQPDLGTAIRTGVVLVMAWVVVFVTGKAGEIKKIDKKSGLFLVLSGITTGLSWLCYYRAMHDGLASVVVPIDKLSILLTVFFSAVFLKERLTWKAGAGLVLITAGTLLLLL